MHIKTSNHPPKTLSELLGEDAEAFSRFIQEGGAEGLAERIFFNMRGDEGGEPTLIPVEERHGA